MPFQFFFPLRSEASFDASIDLFDLKAVHGIS
jgi:hypothetical protein